MIKTIKTYKNFEDFNEDDYVRIYTGDGINNNSAEFKLWYKDVALSKFQNNLLEVVRQAPRKKLTKEYLLDRKLSEFPFKCWYYTHKDEITYLNLKDIATLDYNHLYLDPPSKELIEVVPPFAKEELKKTLRLKDVKKDYTYKVYMKGICATRILKGDIMLSVCSDGAIDILEEYPSSKWLVKSIIEIIEVSGNYSLEELRKLYPNCLYKRTSEGDWLE